MLAIPAEICQKQRAGTVFAHRPALTTTMSKHRMADRSDSVTARHSNSGERWLPIPGYEGHYEVSDQGRVRSLARIISRTMADGSVQHQLRPERFLRQYSRNGSWYPRVTLTVEFEKKTVSVHTLVLSAFVGACPDGQECRHLDGDFLNNRLGNLEWGTHPENEADKIAHGTRVNGERIKNAALTVADVRFIRRECALGRQQKDLARQFGVSRATICRIVRGTCWGHVP